jgi:hypothetical protein
MDYTEPSGGFTLGFDFGSGSTVATFDLIANAAFRTYENDNKPGVFGTWGLAFPNAPTTPPGTLPVAQSWTIAAPEISDLRIGANPTFLYSTDLGKQLSIGVKMNVGISYSTVTITQDLDDSGNAATVNREGSETALRIVPELGAGVSFRLMPNRFAVHAGFGIELFSYLEKVITTKQTITGTGSLLPAGTTEGTVTEKTMGLPGAQFAAGFTLNFTAATAMDILAISKNLDVDETRLTVFFTLKK